MSETTGGMRTDAAINEIEGFLLWEAEKRRARSRAEEFCAGLPWLTGTQRAEVARHYCRDQAELSRDTLERIAARATELRAEYAGVHRALRRRLLTGYAAGTVALAAAVGFALAGR
ncbi:MULTISPECIES: hypothetical protein [Streptomyces]|uniref:Cytochrome C oxidase subunit I n=1 Tax=Streptomyces ramulosus TaxID=47762 RepID=A0ABW1FJV1_9ACTN